MNAIQATVSEHLKSWAQFMVSHGFDAPDAWGGMVPLVIQMGPATLAQAQAACAPEANFRAKFAVPGDGIVMFGGSVVKHNGGYSVGCWSEGFAQKMGYQTSIPEWLRDGILAVFDAGMPLRKPFWKEETQEFGEIPEELTI